MYVLVDGIARHAQAPGDQTDVTAGFLPGPSDHDAGFFPDRRPDALRTRSDAITGKGLQYIVDVLPDHFAACLSQSMLNGLAKLLQIAWPAFFLKDAERNWRQGMFLRDVGGDGGSHLLKVRPL